MKSKEFMRREPAAFLLGGLIGAGAAFLFSPSSGRETREKLQKTAEEVRDSAQEYISESAEAVKTTVEKGRQYFNKRKALVKSPIEACMDAYSREKRRLETTH